MRRPVPATSLSSAALALAALVLAACSNAAGPSASPTGPAPATSPRAADDPGDGGANFASPPEPEPQTPQPAPEVSPELAARIKRQFGDNCRYERSCNDMIGVDCDAAVDGPYYYVRRDNLEIVSRCGGYCMKGCTDCPPKAWTCPTY